MKHFGKSFILSAIFGTLAIVAFALKYYVIAGFLCWPAFLFNADEIKKYASAFQLTNFHVITILSGLITDVATGQKYFLYTISQFMLTFAGGARLVFFKSWGVNKNAWAEPFGLLASYGIYFYACSMNAGDWRGWVLPTFSMLFMTYIGLSIFRDARAFRAKQGEAVGTQAGRPAVEFALPDNRGGTVRLSDFRDKNHVLLLFVRGDWCPTCHIMIRTYEKNREKFLDKEVVTLGISPDNGEVNKQILDRLGWKTHLLTDETQEVTRQYGLHFFSNNPETKYPEGVPLPASVLIDKQGIIRYVSTPGKANEFLDPSHIFPILAQLN